MPSQCSKSPLRKKKHVLPSIWRFVYHSHSQNTLCHSFNAQTNDPCELCGNPDDPCGPLSHAPPSSCGQTSWNPEPSSTPHRQRIMPPRKGLGGKGLARCAACIGAPSRTAASTSDIAPSKHPSGRARLGPVHPVSRTLPSPPDAPPSLHPLRLLFHQQQGRHVQAERRPLPAWRPLHPAHPS